MNFLAKAWAWIRGRKPAPEPDPLAGLREALAGEPARIIYDLSKPAKNFYPITSPIGAPQDPVAYWRERNRQADREIRWASRKFARAVLEAMES